MKALIMGGGMSGLAAAINLIDLGLEVEVIEAGEIFGGRASSWIDDDGDMIDNALHVFFPYYVNLMAFFKKMGVAGNISWKRSEFAYMLPGGKAALSYFPDLPAPLHMAVSLAGFLVDYNAIPRWKVLASLFSLGRAITYSQKKIDKLDTISFKQWAEQLAPEGSLKHLEPGVNGLTFTPSGLVSAKVMLNWIRKISVSATHAKVGFANGGLGEIWVDTCLDYIRSHGGKCTAKKSVTAINMKDGKIDSVMVGKQKRKADLYVSALSPYVLRKVLPSEAMKYDYFKDLNYFQEAPSLSLQVWFDRKLTDIDVTIFSHDCVFNTYADLSNVLPHIFKDGTMFEMVLAPADDLQHLSDEVIFDMALRQIKERFPHAKGACVKKWKIVRERQGVYRPLPGMERHRPYQRTPLSNFYLTGDYTQTPVSSGGMEAAIWTANRCAELIAQDKLNQAITLNEEFSPAKGLLPVINVGIRAVLFIAGYKIAKRLLCAIFSR